MLFIQLVMGKNIAKTLGFQKMNGMSRTRTS